MAGGCSGRFPPSPLAPGIFSTSGGEKVLSGRSPVVWKAEGDDAQLSACFFFPSSPVSCVCLVLFSRFRFRPSNQQSTFHQAKKMLANVSKNIRSVSIPVLRRLCACHVVVVKAA